MFLGECLCFLPYLYMMYFSKSQIREAEKIAVDKKLSLKFNKLYFGIPAIFDLLGSACNFIGLTMATASTSQLMSAANILCVAILSYFILKKRYTKFQMFGIGLLIGGILLIGTGSILGSGNGVF